MSLISLLFYICDILCYILQIYGKSETNFGSLQNTNNVSQKL